VDTEALKRAHRLVDVIESYGVVLKREGRATYRALCPFHHERTPSFWVDARETEREHYWCFGQCGARGDVIAFVMQSEGCSFIEACERLGERPRNDRPAPRHQVEPPGSPPGGRSWEALDSRQPEGQLLERAVSLYEERLWTNERALAYVRRRAITEEVARKQRLGYADGHSLSRYLHSLTEHEGLLALALEVGLMVERPPSDGRPSRLREFFYDRLIVPELRSGHPIWCVGRAIEDSEPRPEPPGDAPRHRRPKYLSIPGQKPLLGLEHVEGARTVFLLEGPVDWLAALSWGLPAFAVGGTHFPAERLPSFTQAETVYGVFDPDRAGQSAAERFGPLFGSRWRPIRLPNNVDLAELAALGEQGHRTFQVLVGRARAMAWSGSHA
jgi:DNA primase